jgi:hypothetical protein
VVRHIPRDGGRGREGVEVEGVVSGCVYCRHFARLQKSVVARPTPHTPRCRTPFPPSATKISSSHKHENPMKPKTPPHLAQAHFMHHSIIHENADSSCPSPTRTAFITIYDATTTNPY